MFIKKVISLIMIFLIAFTTQVQEKEIYGADTFTANKSQAKIQVVEEKCNLPDTI